MKNYFSSMIILILCTLASCRLHNVPIEQNPNRYVAPNTFKVFVDLNGTFYPENWKTSIGPHKRYSSLYLTAMKKGKLSILEDFEVSMLTDFEQMTQDKDRIVVFIHGYNSPVDVAEKNYNILRSKLNLNPQKDGVVEFFWDGLAAKDPLSSGKIWFNAAGYSQMAGEFGLRKLLNAIHNKDVIIISHSRGASVVLSSFSNPPFNPKFYKKTNDLKIPINNTVRLAENHNRIISIMLAPAIGEIDFAKQDDINTYRDFSAQLKRVHITVNEKDKILKKFVGIPSKFNPTNLGSDLTAHNNLSNNYNFFRYTLLELNDHAFDSYVNHPTIQNLFSGYVNE